MVIDYGSARRWTPEPLEAVVRQSNSAGQSLIGLQDELLASRPLENWRGDAGDRAAEVHAGLTDQLEEIVAAVASVRRAAADASDRVELMRHKVLEAEELAVRNGFRIDDDGTVSGLTHLAGIVDVQDLLNHRIAVELRDRVAEILRDAEEIDEDLSVVLKRALHNELSIAKDVETLAGADGAGYVHGSALHAHLADKHKVQPDNRPLGLLGGLLDRFAPKDENQGLNRAEADLLIGLGGSALAGLAVLRFSPLAGALGIIIGGLNAKRFLDMKDLAEAKAEECHPAATSLHNNTADAYRHAYWNALMTKEFGVDFAEKFGTAHEQKEGGPAGHTMDLHNNEVGRNIAVDHPTASREELATLVGAAVHNGETVRINDFGELVPTGDDATSRTPPDPKEVTAIECRERSAMKPE